MGQECCVICLQELSIDLFTTCCSKAIHETCLKTWFNYHESKGRCPYCRTSIAVDKSGDEDLEYMWTNPRGYIMIADIDGSCDISMQTMSRDVPEYIICPYEHIDTLSDSHILDSTIIVLTDENGNYSDVINIPIGWVVCVNGAKCVLQLSSYLRVEVE